MGVINMRTLGGMNINELNFSKGNACPDTIQLGKTPYNYELLYLHSEQEYIVKEPTRCCLFNIGDNNAKLCLNGNWIDSNQYVLGNLKAIKLSASVPTAVLIAYYYTEIDKENYGVYPLTDAKKVNKPWGYEMWLTGEPSNLFAFKKIYIKAGNRTSLQYHKIKRETNFIISGSVKLSYNENVKPIESDEYSIQTSCIDAPFVIDVFPNTIHRIEALTDLLLYEVSTPELDDVVRLQDDAGRTDGKVQQEHEANNG